MFRRVLVANRGEVARRIIRTLNKMNIESVAVFSTADKDACYLQEASHKVCIGPTKSQHSYLCEEAILQAALQTDCEALHPGFGFLSENARFVERCRLQNLQFIGPRPALINLMGDKAKARETFKNLGFKVIDGSKNIITSPEHGLELAKKVGFPVLLKARAGGGGKGMRLVNNKHEFLSKFHEASLEALSAFNDKFLYLEKFIEQARHIEFQVLIDSYKNALILGERECSIQRNNQKLIEEAPANNLSETLRNQITEHLSMSLSQIGYTNAGTVEFLLDKNNQLYFMEMNTRLQVEHPVTEMITGLDIVEQQVRIAANQKLSFSQKDIKFDGAAIEFRINAEDPKKNFSHSPGKISSWQMPENSFQGPVRIETHGENGYTIPPYYDSMLLKLIVWGKDRSQALRLAKKALAEMHIEGIQTTLELQKKILAHPSFQTGNYDCSFLACYLEELVHA